MYYCVAFALLTVLVIKYYTVNEIHKLEYRMETVRRDLRRMKQRLHDVQQLRSATEADEMVYEERFRHMMVTVEDLQMRFSIQDEIEEEPAVSTTAFALYAS